MGDESSLSVGGQPVFDLNTQQGVTSLLIALRNSQLSSKEKNEVRDLIFLYTNGDKDENIRISLEEKIVTHGIRPVASPKQPEPKKTPKKTPTIGTFRSTPSFTVGTVTVQSEEKSQPRASQPAQMPAPAVAEPLPEPVQPRTETPLPPTVPAAPSQPAPDVAAVDAALSRIREIKASVNEQVGNPVSLVEMDAVVGREYMAALLDAMKKVNSGSSATAAMSRLEVAYAAVQNLGTAEPDSQAPTTSARAVESTSPSVQPAHTSIPKPTPPASPIPPAPPRAVVPSPEPEPLETTEPEQAEPPRIPIHPAHANSAQAERSIPIKSTTRAPFATESVPRQPVRTAPASSPQRAPALSSLSDTMKVATTAAIATATEVQKDPLFTSEIDNGLQQLLEEWPIFKKSGIFGTGPKGRQHPLYKKISNLQIPLLLAGRFEGATQEIKQSITDYMNGWRYEQGLIYEQRETFEHYLRRVIRHIIDLRNNKM